MRQFNKFRGTKGWLWLYERQLRLRSMHNQKEAEKRLRTLIFWEKHGDEAAMEAFSISRRTLFRWQEALRREAGKLNGLDKKSTAPMRRRSRPISPELETKIITLRRDHHRLGKSKIAVLCHISESKAGRILNDIKRRGLLTRYAHVRVDSRTGRMREKIQRKQMKIRRPKVYKQGIEIDTIIRFLNGTKRYIYTAIDINRKFAFGGAYSNHSSESAADFLQKLISIAPFPIHEI